MSKKREKQTAIVVGKLAVPVHGLCGADQPYPGAGVGGVSTAARLAKAGFDVTVFEKNDFTGGRCSLIHHDGYVLDSPHCCHEAHSKQSHSDSIRAPRFYSSPIYSMRSFQTSTLLSRLKVLS